VTWRDVPGYFDWEDLYDEVVATAPADSTVVEVGVLFGRSLLYLAERVRESGKYIRVVGVDRWIAYPALDWLYDPDADRNKMNFDQIEMHSTVAAYGSVFYAFRHFLVSSGLRDLIGVLRMPSLSAARRWPADLPPCFVFIDGDHTYESVKADINAWWDKGCTWMAGHDYDPESWPDVVRAVDEKFGSRVEKRGTCWVVRR
jgi:hypothetical protein